MDQLQRRLELQEKLESLMASKNVYFQPPETLMMQYPCIRYKIDSVHDTMADNIPYNRAIRYQLTLIDRDPDSEYFNDILAIPYTSFERYYASENLNHFVFTTYC